jgi:hypothetical protein
MGYLHPRVTTKSIAILISVMFVVALTFLCRINIEVEEDLECWEKFKAMDCDILNPQGR